MGAGLPPQIPLDNGHALSIVVVAVIFPILATLSCIGRIAARRVQKMKLGADDYVVMGALVSFSCHDVLSWRCSRSDLC